MAEFLIILKQVMILLLITGMGYAAGRAGMLDKPTTRKLSEMVLYLTAPMLVLNSFFIEFSAQRVTGMLWVMGLSLLTFVMAIVLSRLMFRRFPEDTSAVLNFSSVFSNAGYMGLPLMGAVFGTDGIFYGSFYVVAFNIFLWSYGFILFGGRGTARQIARKVLLNPALIAVYVGLVIFLGRIPVPFAIQGSVATVGSMTMPLSMLIIGAVISTSPLRDVFSDWRVYLACAVRLILMPALGIVLMVILRAPVLPGTIVVTALAMPAATATTMFAELYEKNSKLASRIVAVSTLLCLATVPVVITFTTWFAARP